MIMRVPFGDWSGDGHKIYREVWVSSPNWNTIPNTQTLICHKYGSDFFRTMSNNYEEYTLRPIHWQALHDAGYGLRDFNKQLELENIIWYGEGPEPEVTNFYEDVVKHPENWQVFIEALIEMFFMLLNAYNANITVLDYNPFPYNYNIEEVGYGALSAEDC